MAKGDSSGSKTTIIVALIGLIGVLGGAWIAHLSNGPVIVHDQPAAANQTTSQTSAAVSQANVVASQTNAAVSNTADDTGSGNAALAEPPVAAKHETVRRTEGSNVQTRSTARLADQAGDQHSPPQKQPPPEQKSAWPDFAGQWSDPSQTVSITQDGAVVTVRSLNRGGYQILRIGKDGVATTRAFLADGRKASSEDDADAILTMRWRRSGDELIYDSTMDVRRPYQGMAVGLHSGAPGGAVYRRTG